MDGGRRTVRRVAHSSEMSLDKAARFGQSALVPEARTLSRVATTTMVATTPFIAFWLIGDQSLHGDKDDLDYLFRISIAPTAVLMAGVVALLAFVAAARYLSVNRAPADDGRVAQLVALLMLAGIVLAFGARIVTAGVIGANIGGGGVLLFGLPLWMALVAAAVIRFWRSGRSSSTTSTGTQV